MSNPEPEQAITPAQIAELLEKIPEDPYFVSFDDGGDCPNHANSGLAVVDTGRAGDWPIARHCHWPVAKFISAAPAIARYALELAKENERWRMAAELCAQDVAFFSGNTQLEPSIARRFCLLCNDVFGWATADAEQVVWDLIPELYAIYQDKGESGLIEWIATQRGVRPMPEVEESLSRAKQIVAERNQLSQEVERLRTENERLKSFNCHGGS